MFHREEDMGLVDLMQHMSMEQQPDRLHRQAQTTHGLVASRNNKVSPCQQEADSQGGEVQIPRLPEDIWCHIHSLMPMRSAARAACVSRAFLRSWRCHPNLTFTERTLRLNKKGYENDDDDDDDIARDFCSKVDQIMKKHSGIGVKKLIIHMFEGYNGYVDSWLQVAVRSGIEELSLGMPKRAEYRFPCSLLSNGSGDSIRCLRFLGCSFRPATELGCLRSLTKLYLYHVSFTGDELWWLLSNSFALEVLGIRYCEGMGWLKVPCTLQLLRYLEVLGCWRKLERIESKAPNISSFNYEGRRIQLSLGETLQMKELTLSFCGAVHCVCVELPSSMPNLKVATISSGREINTTLLHCKYLHLKSLNIKLVDLAFPPAYDYFSLVSFFDGCPSLETLVLDVSQYEKERASIFADPSDLRKMQGQQHLKMKTVKILGFTSAKSLVELTCHIVESMTSLECLTLETRQSSFRCFESAGKSNKCSPLPVHVRMEAQRALLAIRTYIEPKVPSMVKLHVVETCRRCHAFEL